MLRLLRCAAVVTAPVSHSVVLCRFGFQGPEGVPDGWYACVNASTPAYACDYQTAARMLRLLGFNAVRLPIAFDNVFNLASTQAPLTVVSSSAQPTVCPANASADSWQSRMLPLIVAFSTATCLIDSWQS
jgi:hypothetical protein